MSLVHDSDVKKENGGGWGTGNGEWVRFLIFLFLFWISGGMVSFFFFSPSLSPSNLLYFLILYIGIEVQLVLLNS